MADQPQIELTADDLQAVLLMADVVVRAEGRKALRLTEPLSQKIEKYFEALSKSQQAAQDAKPEAAGAEPAATEAESKEAA